MARTCCGSGTSSSHAELRSSRADYLDVLYAGLLRSWPVKVHSFEGKAGEGGGRVVPLSLLAHSAAVVFSWRPCMISRRSGPLGEEEEAEQIKQSWQVVKFA